LTKHPANDHYGGDNFFKFSTLNTTSQMLLCCGFLALTAPSAANSPVYNTSIIFSALLKKFVLSTVYRPALPGGVTARCGLPHLAFSCFILRRGKSARF